MIFGWLAHRSEMNELDAQPKFKSPIYVATADAPCRIRICFGDGSLFKGGGFAISFLDNTCIEETLKRMVKDDAATNTLSGATKVLKVLLEFLAGTGPIGNFNFSSSGRRY